LGSITGTTPGIPLPGGYEVLPLNWDVFTDVVLLCLNTPWFVNFMSTLSPFGNSMAQINTYGPIPGNAGYTLSFAYALFHPYNFVSNPINIEIIP